jgi:site-specific recombinase XerD
VAASELPLLQVIEYFLEDSALALSKATMYNYRYNLQEFSGSMAGLGVASLHEVTPVQIRKYLVNAQDDGYSKAAVHQRYRVVRRLFSWCVAQSFITTDPMVAVRKPAKPKPVPYHLPIGQVETVLAACANTTHPVRDQAIVYLLLDTGLRRAELASVLLTDLNLQDRLVTVRLGKGGKGRLVPISSLAAHVLAEWLVDRPSDIGDRLFGLTGAGLQMLLYRLSKHTGVHVFCHALRHTFATLYGGDVQDLQKILGHAEVSTTAEIYRFRENAGLVRFHDERSPVTLLAKK